ncbi:MAG TPA: ADOP family duplicated permease [Vicinamibacterales bacterium]|nr:ADOP family duplicated permease [Vicinamibacterales bacterium]
MSRREDSPPHVARWLLERLLPRDEREFVIGDLEETFAAWQAAGAGRRFIRLRYWRAAFGALAAFAAAKRATTPFREPPQHARRKGDGLMSNLLRDARYGLRLLLRRPGFTIVAVATLALGIGANAAIFTVANTLLVKPMPYVDAEELVILTENNLPRGWTSFSVSPANFLDWRDHTKSFARMAAWGGRSYNYTGGETPERLRGLVGTEGFLEMLGGAPILGRGFHPEEFEPGKDLVVILNHGFWRSAFGGNPGVLQQSIMLNGQSHTVVGVMHPHWRFGGRETALFAPRAFSADERGQRGGHFLNVVARLKPGATPEQAQIEMSDLAARLAEQFPDTNKNWGAVVTPLRDAVVGDLRPMLRILLGAVGLVLLIACANVANMLLARATVRSREMAIRSAIGAGRSRIVRQLLTESVLLAAIGGAIGLALADWGTSSLFRAYPTLLPRASDMKIDGTVLIFAGGLSLLTAVLFGLVPAFAASRTQLNESLKEGGRTGGMGVFGRWLRSALVVSEVAVALVLLAGAGLLLRSFAQLTRVEPGFETDRRLSVTTVLPWPKYSEPALAIGFSDQVLERIRALPGVESAALTSTVPISGSDELYSIEFEGRPPLPPGQGVSALYYLVSPDYFRTIGIPLLKGRAFTDQDRDGTARVAIVNDEFVRLHYPSEDPIGKRIRMGRNATIIREIVGVVGSVKHYTLRDKTQAQMYEPFRQFPSTGMTFVLKTSVAPATIAAAVRREIQAVDPEQPIANTGTLSEMVSTSMMLPRVQTMLLAVFAGIALVLAAVGLYGVMAFGVSQRTQEIGIRMALGARPGSVLRLVIGEALTLTAIGLAIGLAGAVLLGRALSNLLAGLLFQVAPSDLATLAAVALVLTLVTLFASLIPAKRATRIDPVEALRSE